MTVAATGPRQVTFTLATPLGGFLQALTQPIAPAHLLADVPVDALPDDPFGLPPVGSGPFALVELSESGASLVPAAILAAEEEGGSPPASPGSTDSLTTPAPTLRPSRPMPYLAGIEFRFYADPEVLAADFRAGELDAASGLSPQAADALATMTGVRLVRYPTATLTAALLNLRPAHPEFCRSAGAHGAARRHRPGRPHRVGLRWCRGGRAEARSRRARRCSTRLPTRRSPTTARAPASRCAPPGGRARTRAGTSRRAAKPLSIEVLSPTEASNPDLFEAAKAVVADWKAIGLDVTHVPLAPGDFVTERLATGAFEVAVADMRVGLDPDLYPLLASSQTLTGGSNIMRHPGPTLDALLAKARAPGTEAARKAAYAALQEHLAKGRYLLPLAFPDEVVVFRDTRPRARDPAGRRPLGSILGCANMAPRRRPVAASGGPCRGGGIGRRAGFRYQWPQGRVGSSPSLGTIPFGPLTVTPAQVAELVYAYV